MYRRYRVPSLWRELNRMQRDMDRLFDTSYPAIYRRTAGFPQMNIWSDEEELVLTAEVPGINPDEIDISVVGENLTISGERTPDILEEGSRYHRQERGSGTFSRTVELPFPVDVDQVKAVFENGVLQVTLPRTEADKPRKIAVKSAS